MANCGHQTSQGDAPTVDAELLDYGDLLDYQTPSRNARGRLVTGP